MLMQLTIDVLDGKRFSKSFDLDLGPVQTVAVNLSGLDHHGLLNVKSILFYCEFAKLKSGRIILLENPGG